MAEVKTYVARPGCQGRGLLPTLVLLIALTAITSTGSIVAQRSQPAVTSSRAATQPPRLVVFIVVDQMRADYINLYGHQWTKGLRRLLDTGAVFPMAAYPYSYTVTCAGHATISTGSYPSTHGMIGNEWYDLERRRSVPCTEDPALTSVAFGGGAGSERHGPTRLATLTFADELRLQATRPPTIVTVSQKPRSSLTFAGQPGPSTYAVWLEESTGLWATSSAYATAPWPVVDAYVKAHPVAAAYGSVWTRTLPESAYLFTDVAPSEWAPAAFPHPVESKSGKPDSEFVARWRRSPMSDRYVGDLVQHLVRELKLGQTPGTDMLSVSFSGADLVGHDFGPHSHEVQDILIRVDEAIGALLGTLDRLVGRERYAVALTSDHGVALMPEQDQAVVAGSGRMSPTAIRAMINTAIESVIGPGTHVTARTGPNVYLAPGVLTRLLATAGARETVTKAIESFEGLARVYWAPDLASRAATDDEFLRAARLSYMPGRSGDLTVIPDPYWMAQASGTTHGTPYDYDQRVPLLFAGAGIKPGRYLVPASPADIAPTLAHLIGITLAHTDGRLRVEAIR
jgi:predicted AlkP superfamily pyrophosphatase or phosphodiesterase